MKPANRVISKGREFEICIQRGSFVNLNVAKTRSAIQT